MQKIRLGWPGLGKLEVAFLLLFSAFVFVRTAGRSPLSGWLGLFAILLGLAVAFRISHRYIKTAIWRLRNRLIVAYIFIAVVPVVLVTTLLGLAGYAVIEQMSIYLVNRELDHRESSLLRLAEASAHFPARDPDTAVNRFRMQMRNIFPDAHLLISGPENVRYPENSDITHPPAQWVESEKSSGGQPSSGLVIKDGKLYAWAHAAGNDTEVTVLAPLTPELLSSFVPGLGDAAFRPIMGRLNESHIPPPVNAFDFRVNGVYPVDVPEWNAPTRKVQLFLRVDTRLSSVMAIMFGHKTVGGQAWSEVVLDLLIVFAVIFLILEMASLYTGVRLSRSITGAVHELYQGMQHVKEGDFAYRVPVKGDDQLADLTSSFNTMTENLSRLIVVAKEKERLESELEIAREVQSNLFPKNAPQAKNLELRGLCQPARMVSGDYYDFMPLPQQLGFAIGDVAGKGISAALLMATIQSTMRTQLSPTNGYGPPKISTARLVATLNRQLYATTSPEKYATFFFALFNEDTSALTYTNAGHLSPLLLRGPNVQSLDPTGTVVGAFANAKYDERTLEMQAGDVLVAYTDGIVEPENEYDEMFGEDRLRDLLVKFEHADSAEMIARTMEAVKQWTHSPEQADDMTMVVARRI